MRQFSYRQFLPQHRAGHSKPESRPLGSPASDPRTVRLDSAKAVMEWARIVKLGRPVRTLEIELLWRLREPCQLGHSSERIGPVEIQSDLRRLSVRHGRAVSCLDCRNCCPDSGRRLNPAPDTVLHPAPTTRIRIILSLRSLLRLVIAAVQTSLSFGS